MAFRRKLTEQVEKIKNTNEGKQSPQIVEALERIDAELQELKKAKK